MLEDLQDHIADGHLHVVAPPGSGKTVLGLEVVIRLNKPSIIFAPTLAIRNQWIHRFCELFLQTNTVPDWISRDIRNPRFMTIVTYQGVHAACTNLEANEDEVEWDDNMEIDDDDYVGGGNANLDAIVSALQDQKIGTFVVDEAHHLKNSWWRTLNLLKEKLRPVVVGLTATPPYDVTPAEWQRYIDLNGPVDSEISVPELIIEGDLCPHQDYVHFTFPTAREKQSIVAFRENVQRLFDELKSDTTLIRAMENHPIWKNPSTRLEWIYENLSCYSACLIFLKANGRVVNEIHLDVIGDTNSAIPGLDYGWMEVLLDFYLFRDTDNFEEFEEHRRSIEARLRRYGALERRTINLRDNKRLSGLLASSTSKLDGICSIVDFEYRQLGRELRMVILSDFIRREFFASDERNDVELNKIGVIPIFEKLRRVNTDGKKLGVLSGSIVIIPATAYPAFAAKAAKYGINKFDSEPVPFDNSYVIINQGIGIGHHIVHIVTEIFQRGEVEILIGTKSLLGEGWDAPAINSLVLATFVGSFVLSNQMRGRAIRTEAGNSEKTGNIWHLACIDPTSPAGGADFDLLQRRFRGFVGISFKNEPAIENGINRLNLPVDIHREEIAVEKNSEMFALAGARAQLRGKWEEALSRGVHLTEEIKIPFAEGKDFRKEKSFYLTKTIQNLIATLTSGFLWFVLDVLDTLGQSARSIRTSEDLFYFFAIIGGLGVIIFGKLTFKTLRLYLQYRDISKDIQQIGTALLNALIHARVIRPGKNQMTASASVDGWGAVYCHLEGGTAFDKSTFINALQEIVGPVANPRYLIIRESRFMKFIQQRDFHSVPEVLGRNKESATYFMNEWKHRVGKCYLVFTRSIPGRKMLLKARIKSLASQLEERVQRVNKWT